MRLRRGLALGLLAGGLAVGGAYAAQGLAFARQRPIVVVRFLAGYFDRRGGFVPTAGRGASNVDRNAVLMFITSGAVDTGPNLKATVPLTLAEQAELDSLAIKVRRGQSTPDDPSDDPTEIELRRFRELGGDPRAFFEPGQITRKLSPDANAAIVATGSISTDSVRIVSVAGGGESLAKGVFFKVRRRGSKHVVARRFVFDPRFAAATFNRPDEIDYHPEGFEANTTYTVSMPGGNLAPNEQTTVTNLDGVTLAERFSTQFTTSNRYVQDFTRPEIRETSPGEGSVNVPSDADVDIVFSEPMDPESFLPPRFANDPQATVIMRYKQDSRNGTLAGRTILTQVRIKPQTAGNIVQLRPLQGFGRGPYIIEVIITAGVTDLSGNNIIRQQQFEFTTEDDPTAEAFAEVSETFDNTLFQDTSFTAPSGDNLLATWNAKATPGVLTTAVANATFFTQGPSPTAFVNVWFSRAVRWQMLYPSSDMGGRPRTLTGFSWVPQGTLALLTYPNTQVKVGHANVTVAAGGFAGGAAPPGPVIGNYRETPVTVSEPKNYKIPAASGGVVRGPTWGRNFNFDGSTAVILEVEHTGNGTTAPTAVSENWRMDGNYSLNAMTFSLFNDTPPVVQSQRWYMSVRWDFLTPGAEAQSLWYNVLQPTVRWVPQQLVPFSQPQGTSISISWQGAKADINDPTRLDSSSITPSTTDIRTLAGYPFVRWHVELVNNLATGESPTIDTLTMPYTYR